MRATVELNTPARSAISYGHPQFLVVSSEKEQRIEVRSDLGSYDKLRRLTEVKRMIWGEKLPPLPTAKSKRGIVLPAVAY
jgi:hypothetical protein